MKDQWFHKVFSVTESNFESLALEIFRFQYENNTVYRDYTDLLKISPDKPRRMSEIPFLPIRFFKTHAIKSTLFEPALVFESSGTTGSVNSQHFIKDPRYYTENFLNAFTSIYGAVSDWCILGLLPSYLERNNSSLVFMVNELIKKSGHARSGFFLYDHDKLRRSLHELEASRQKTLLIGVSFALLDFITDSDLPLKYTVVMETGGMKGRKTELIRQELHEILKAKFHVDQIHSEYGMTELLSQAYSVGNGIFQCPGWMKVFLRDEEDPLQTLSIGTNALDTGSPAKGIINIIDLANIYSCSFIATEDAGIVLPDGRFEVLGRVDNSDIRGCSLMAV